MSAVLSVDASSTMIHSAGLTLCPQTESNVWRMYFASSFAGVMMT
jgi:hypothetical protein